MGLQASAITHFGDTAVSTVVVTSTLARIAEAALDRMWPTGRALPSVATPRLLALTWIGYLAGAVGGVLLVRAVPWPLLVPAALLVIAVAVGGSGPRAHSAISIVSRSADNRNPKGRDGHTGPAYSDASRTGCTVL